MFIFHFISWALASHPAAIFLATSSESTGDLSMAQAPEPHRVPSAIAASTPNRLPCMIIGFLQGRPFDAIRLAHYCDGLRSSPAGRSGYLIVYNVSCLITTMRTTSGARGCLRDSDRRWPESRAPGP